MKTSFDIYHHNIAALRNRLNEQKSEKEQLGLLLTIANRLAYVAPTETIHSTKELLNRAIEQDDQLAIVEARNILAYCYTTNYDFDTAVDLLTLNEKSLLKLAPNSELRVECYSNFARLTSLKSEFSKANEYLGKGIEISHNLEKSNEELSTALLINAYGRMSQNHYRMGDIKTAQKYVQIALKIDDKRETIHHAILYNVIGILYAHEEFEEAYKKAIIYYNKALNIWEKEGYYFYSSFVFSNLSIIYQNQKQFDKALECSHKSLALFKKIAYRRNIGMVTCLLGKIHLEMNEPHKCIEYQIEARKIYSELNDTHEYLFASTKLAEALIEIEDFDSALDCIKEAEAIQKETNYYMLGEINRLYSYYYEKTKDFKKAFLFQVTHIELLEKDKESTIQEIEKKYEIVIKERELIELNKQKVSLKNHNNDLENFAAKAGHDLKAPIATINMYCHLIRNTLNQNKKETTQQYVEVIRTSANSILQLITDLTTYTLAGSNELEKEEIDLADLLFIVKNNLQEQITRSNAQINCNEILPIVNCNYRGMNQIMQNIISNGIKFQKENNRPSIHISCKEKEGFTVLEIKDNGIGIAPKNHEKIFNVFERLHSKEEYSGSGIGLATCRKIARQMGGDIKISSEKDFGTTFSIYIPD